MADGTSGRLRVVVFTAGPLSPVNRAFFEHLAGDPQLEVRAVLVDEYQAPRRPLVLRIFRGLRSEGPSWICFKIIGGLESLIRRTTHRLFAAAHRRAGGEASYEGLTRASGIPVHHLPDIQGEPSLALIRSLHPQLGVIVGGRILRDAVTKIPEYGTLNLHKRKVPDYRGGGPVGYWEVLAGETSIGVTVHYAEAQVDAGAVLAEATIPIEEGDTLESLGIKADILGARLYEETIRGIASGRRLGVAQDTSRGHTYRAPSEIKVRRLERRLRRRAARSMPAGPRRWAQARVVAQYIVLLPWLLALRRRLIRRRRAPICILYHHLIANRPINHMVVPLQTFVKQVEFLRQFFAVISLDEAVERLQSGSNDEIAVSITFDDGYKDNTWAVEYLRHLGIPASFFVSIGHVRDGSPFAHDRQMGFESALPMSEAEVRQLVSCGFTVGSHGVYHEDFGDLDAPTAARLLVESRESIGTLCGRRPDHFSFPFGLRGKNMTAESFGAAETHYRFVYSAYGGYNFPASDRRHFLRICAPPDLPGLAMIMDGYTGFRDCLSGNAWGRKTAALPPYEVGPPPRRESPRWWTVRRRADAPPGRRAVPTVVTNPGPGSGEGQAERPLA
jgi:peptidoglycan/xylan/chitin deacetylase (PgdA/CDA1 family)